MLRRVTQWVVPKMDFPQGGWWIVDDTSFAKKGKHSVGVTRQYCGQLGKRENCQVAVSVSLASAQGSLPVAWQLYLPKDWANDAQRRTKAGIPDDITFATKPHIALQQLRTLLAEGAPKHCVLADAAYGVDHAFRQGLSDMGLPYMVGITSSVMVWPPGVLPRPQKPKQSVDEHPAVVAECTPDYQPVSVKTLALTLPAQAFATVTWRQGSNAPLTARFAAVRVRHAGSKAEHKRLRPEQWLLIEWPEQDTEPLKYYLSTLPEDASLQQLVNAAHQRWRIERDYQDLKQDLGLGHYEGRNWRGFHHHASLSIATYGFLMAERIQAERAQAQKSTVEQTQDTKKNFPLSQVPAFPEDYIPRGSPARTASRANVHHQLTSSAVLAND